MLFDATEDRNGGVPDKYFFLNLDNSGQLNFWLEDDTDDDFQFTTSASSIAAGTWTHIAVTWDMAGQAEVYVNGGLVQSFTI